MRTERLFAAESLEDGEIRRHEIDGYGPISVCRIGAEYFCFDDTCTHEDASLADGEIDGDEVICPFHMGSFNIRTGDAVRAPCFHPLKVHETAVVDGDLVITLR